MGHRITHAYGHKVMTTRMSDARGLIAVGSEHLWGVRRPQYGGGPPNRLNRPARGPYEVQKGQILWHLYPTYPLLSDGTPLPILDCWIMVLPAPLLDDRIACPVLNDGNVPPVQWLNDGTPTSPLNAEWWYRQHNCWMMLAPCPIVEWW